MNTKIYLDLINKYTLRGNFVNWMNAPFEAFKKTMVTDGTYILMTPICSDFVNRNDKISELYPQFYSNISKTITLSELKDKVKSFPMIDCYDEVEVKCDACDGNGEVEFEFYYNGKYYEKENDCPICDGEGFIYDKSDKPNGKKEYDSSQYFKIGNSCFNIKLVTMLLDIAETLNSDIVLIKQSQPTQFSLFKIGEVELVLMPSHITTQTIAQEIL